MKRSLLLRCLLSWTLARHCSVHDDIKSLRLISNILPSYYDAPTSPLYTLASVTIQLKANGDGSVCIISAPLNRLHNIAQPQPSLVDSVRQWASAVCFYAANVASGCSCAWCLYSFGRCTERLLVGGFAFWRGSVRFDVCVKYVRHRRPSCF